MTSRWPFCIAFAYLKVEMRRQLVVLRCAHEDDAFANVSPSLYAEICSQKWCSRLPRFK